jgi:hypothetical protein
MTVNIRTVKYDTFIDCYNIRIHIGLCWFKYWGESLVEPDCFFRPISYNRGLIDRLWFDGIDQTSMNWILTLCDEFYRWM